MPRLQTPGPPRCTRLLRAGRPAHPRLGACEGAGRNGRAAGVEGHPCKESRDDAAGVQSGDRYSGRDGVHGIDPVLVGDDGRGAPDIGAGHGLLDVNVEGRL